MNSILVALFSMILICTDGFSVDSVIKQESLDKKSRIIYFSYGGYGDSIYALLQCYIYTSKGKERVSLKGAKISIRSVLPNDVFYLTDKEGRQTIPFKYGIYDITFSKPGYQSVKMINYEPHPDEVSSVYVILIKGNGCITEDVSRGLYPKYLVNPYTN